MCEPPKLTFCYLTKLMRQFHDDLRVRNHTNTNKQNKHYRSPFSVVLVTTVVVKGYLGEDFCYGTGVWCGIKSNLDPKIITTWMYIVDIAWQITCYISTCFLYIFLIFVVRFCKYRSNTQLNKTHFLYQSYNNLTGHLSIMTM